MYLYCLLENIYKCVTETLLKHQFKGKSHRYSLIGKRIKMHFMGIKESGESVYRGNENLF